MRLLLDTHTLLWTLRNDPALGPSARRAIASGRNTVFVSAVSVGEIAIKRARERLDVPERLLEGLAENNFQELPISSFHGEQAGALPLFHRDPFDRMLIAQAQAEGLILVTADAAIERYRVRTMAAGR